MADTAPKLSRLGEILKDRLTNLRCAIESEAKDHMWAQCVKLEGRVFELESVWETLMRRGLLTQEVEDE